MDICVIKYNNMKTLYTTLFVLGGFLSLQAQIMDTNWVRQYDRVSSNSHPQIAEMPNGDYLVSQWDKYYQINTDGDSIDAAIENTSWGITYDMLGVSDGVLLTGSFNGHPAIAKMDTNFNIVWSTEINALSGSGRALHADGNDFYVSGKVGFNSCFISNFDAAGDTAWYLELEQFTFTQLTDIIKLSDGDFLASGNVDDYPLAVKFDASGDTVWTYTEYLFISFMKMNAFEKSNGNIVLLGERVMMELDDDGTKLSDTTFTINQFYDMHYEDDTVYMFGYQRDTTWGSEKVPLVELRNTNWDSLGSWTLNDGVHPTADNLFSDAIKTPGGGFIGVGKIRDSIDITANTYNILAVKFNDGAIADTNNNDTTDTVTGINRQLAGSRLTIYPNPANDVLSIAASFTINDVKIIDMQGRIILRKNCATKNEQLDIQSLENGYYVLSVNSMHSEPFIKQ
jgi:hypothetical protein